MNKKKFKNLYNTPAKSDPIPAGFSTVDEVSKELGGLTRSWTREWLNSRVEDGLVETKTIRLVDTNGRRQATKVYKVKE